MFRILAIVLIPCQLFSCPIEIDIQRVQHWPQAVEMMEAHLHSADTDATYILKNPRTNEEVSRRISTCIHSRAAEEQNRRCLMFHFVNEGCWVISIENFMGKEIGFHPNAVSFYVKNGENRLLYRKHFPEEIRRLCGRNSGYSVEASVSIDAGCLLSDVWEPLKLLLETFPIEWMILPANISLPIIAGDGGKNPFLTPGADKAVADVELVVQQIILCLRSGEAARNIDAYRRLTDKLGRYAETYPEETAAAFWKYGAELVQAHRSLEAPRLKQNEGTRLDIDIDPTLDMGESLLNE